MTDKELADALVALGIGEYAYCHTDRYNFINEDWTDASEFVRDWRVAGAMMEKVLAKEWIAIDSEAGEFIVDIARGTWVGTGDSLPRAIIEACVKALQEQT